MLRVSTFFAAALMLASTANAGEFNRNTGSYSTDTNVAAQAAQKDAPHLAVPRKMKSGTAYELHMVQTRDEIYTPVGVRKPEGNGPFPAVLMSRGNGKQGFPFIEEQMWLLEPMHDEMIKRGYVVAFGNFRNEIPQAYNSQERSKNIADEISGGARALKSTATLDSDDYIALIEHVKSLPYVSKVGTIGVSHSGELQAKAAAETTWGAAVPIEGAAYEFLPVDVPNAPKKDGVMHLEDPALVKKLTDKNRAMERIKRIKTPFLHLGRDGDHLQGVFVTNYEWMKEAGVDARWDSANHDVHGYGLLYRNADGTYTPDAMQKEFFEKWMAYFDEKLKK